MVTSGPWHRCGVVVGAVAALLLAACGSGGTDPSPTPPGPVTTSTTSAPDGTDAGGEADPLDREAVYAYCDRATGQDPLCWTTEYGNDVRAADLALEGIEEFGGFRRTEVAGAQGLGDAVRVGTTLDIVQATLERRLELTAIAESAACRVSFDQGARLGVVTVRMDGPRGPQEVVHAFLIENPVFRIGRSLREEAAGLGRAGIGVGTRLVDLRAADPDARLGTAGDATVLRVPPEPAREQLAAGSAERGMAFWLDDADTVRTWAIGVPEYPDGSAFIARPACHRSAAGVGARRPRSW